MPMLGSLVDHFSFALSIFFQNVLDSTRLNLTDVKERVQIQRDDGKNLEIDIVANSSCGRVVLVFVTIFKENAKPDN